MSESQKQIQSRKPSLAAGGVYRLGRGEELLGACLGRVYGAGGFGAPRYALGVEEGGSLAAAMARSAAELTSGRAPAVVHQLFWGASSRDGAVVLAASSHQEVADQVVLARALNLHFGWPVQGVVPPELAREKGVARLPREGDGSPIAASGEKMPGSVYPGLEQILRDWERVAVAQDLQTAPVRRTGPLGSRTLLALSHARLLRRIQRESAADFSVTTCALLHPLPLPRLRDRISADQPLLIVMEKGNLFHGHLVEQLHLAFEGGAFSAVSVEILEVESPIEEAALRERLEQALPELSWGGSDGDFGLLGQKLGILPAGEGGTEILCELGDALGGVELLQVGGGFPAVLSLDGSGRQDKALDGLLLAPHERLPVGPALEDLRRGGRLGLWGSAEDPVALWRSIPLPVRMGLVERDIRIWWCPPSVEGSRGGRQGERAALLALGLKILQHGSSAESPGMQPLLEDPEVKAAYDRVEPLDAELLEGAVSERQARLEPEAEGWLLPASEESSQEWIRPIRDFHLTGRPWAEMESQNYDLPLVPAVLGGLEEKGLLRERFPVYMKDPQSDGAVQPLAEFLRNQVGDRSTGQLLLPWLRLIAEGCAGPEPAREALASSAKELLQAVDASDAGRKQLESELNDLIEKVEPNAVLVPFRKESLAFLLTSALERGRHVPFEQFIARLRSLRLQLEELLLADRELGEEGRSAEALAGSMGSEGGRFFKADVLARSVPGRGGAQGLSQERRSRIEKLRETLSQFLDQEASLPAACIVQAEDQLGSGRSAGVELFAEEEPFEFAQGLFRGLADRFVPLFRAVRTAELEVENAYDPQAHEAALERLSWRGLEASELALFPAVVVIESSERLAGQSLGGLHRLLRSSIPIRTLIVQREGLTAEAAPMSEPNLEEVPADPGYLAMAHREALVVQSSLADLNHLQESISCFLQSAGPAVLTTLLPVSWEPQAWQRLAVAGLAKVYSNFSYDPGAGESWADRFRLQDPQEDSAVVSFECRREEGGTARLEETLTYAHAAAQDVRFRSHFALVSPRFWNEEQVPIGKYLEKYQEEPPPLVPYIWVVDGTGTLIRALMTREMAQACKERQRAWRVLQELAGERNVYVERAEAAAREQAEADVEARISHAREEGKREGAEQAVDRLVAIFSGSGGEAEAAAGRITAGSSASETVKRRAEAEPEPEPEGAIEEEEAAEPETEGAGEEPLAEEPYIDSFLCTSCNDCINLNPVMFQYNEEKQAYIADPAAGTYRELVRAAEVCPARCIHPGTPRPGDETATPELIERAKAFR